MIRAVTEQTVPIQVKTMDPTPEAQAIIDRYQQVWTPTLMLLSPRGDVYHEWNGYLPPDAYLAQLYLGLGKAALKEERFGDAADRFAAVAARHPEDLAAAEALYWAAVARYKGSGNADDLAAGWAELRQRYPDSPWRLKQSFMEE